MLHGQAAICFGYPYRVALLVRLIILPARAWLAAKVVLDVAHTASVTAG